MYIVNIEKSTLIDYICLPVLIVSSDKSAEIKIGSEISNASMEEVIVLKEDVQAWFNANVTGKYKIVRAKIHFENEEEAVHFKTVWI